MTELPETRGIAARTRRRVGVILAQGGQRLSREVAMEGLPF